MTVLVSYDDDEPQVSPSSLYAPTPEREAELAAMPYRDYLRSPEWRERRRVELTIAERRCQRCRRRRPPSELHLHHLTYERRGHENPDDLIPLCADCHRKQHGIAA